MAQSKKHFSMEDYDEWLAQCPWSEDCSGAPYWIGAAPLNRMKTLANNLLADSMQTPDMAQLNGHNGHYFFVYGTLKRGFPSDEMMARSTFIGRGWTVLERFKLIQGEFPVALFDPIDEAKAVQGEVYFVPTPEIKYLDVYEGNGHLYRRKRMNIHLETGKKKICWMYIGVPIVWTAMTKVAPSFRRKKTGLEYYTYLKR